MKRVSNIYVQICSIENIRQAYINAKKNKKSTYGLRVFDRDVEANLMQLHKELSTCTYKTGEYFVFKKLMPKEREIFRLDFRHRVVHHAIMNVLEPVWVSVFTRDTYSCVKKRGIHGCANALKRDLKDIEGTKYCLKLDIKKFYPNIDHAILKNIIRKKIKCARTLKLLDDIRTYLRERLKLEIKSNYQIFPVKSRGIDFVGYVFYHTHILLRKSIKKAMIVKRNNIKSIASYYGWCKHCNTYNLLKKLKIDESIFKQQTSAHTAAGGEPVCI